MLVLSACSTSGGPSSSHPALSARYGADPVTLAVTNNTASPLQLGARPTTDVAIPTASTGLWASLGVIAPGTHCVVLPDSMLLTIGPAGGPDTTSLIWTGSATMRVIALDTASTNEILTSSLFIPDTAAGWSLSIPAAPGDPASATACTP
jgi:hypothetical protein